VVNLLAGVAYLQSGGVRWGEISRAVQVESRDDVTALRDDFVGLRQSIKSAPDMVKKIWSGLRYDFTELRAEARAQTHLAVSRLSGHDRR